MILTNIKISNLYCFDNCEIDLSRRGKKNDIEGLNDSLPQAPSFFYQKVVVISGSNASGKTSLGKILCGTQSLLADVDEASLLLKGISNLKKKASVEIEFVQLNPLRLYRYLITFEAPYESIPKIECKSCQITSEDSLESSRQNIDKIGWNKATSEEYPYKDFQSWTYFFSETTTSPKSLKKEIRFAPAFFFRILKSFDPSIERIVPLTSPGEKTKIRWGYGILFVNGNKAIVDTKGNVTNAERFSKGTYEAIKVAFYLQSMKNNLKKPCSYYLDEPLVYAHPDLEFSLLNLFISFLSNNNSQLFYTTRNNELLNTNFPMNNYIFLSRRGNFTKTIQPTTEQFPEQDLLELIQNDVFHTLPSVDLINALYPK